MTFTRRQFLQALGTAPTLAALPTMARAAGTPHVVVVGGGFGGATVAKHLRYWGGEGVKVTLIEPKAHHTSCVLSNLVLNRRLRLSELRLSFEGLASQYGVSVQRDRAVEVDGTGKRIRLKASGWLDYDYLVLSTGISFKKPAGVDFKLTPHAWIAGGQTRLLANLTDRLGPQSTFILTVPPSPYRCPPGPYERACLVADSLKRKGYDNGDARVLVLDANRDIQAEADTFHRAFDGIYRDIVEYIPDSPVDAVDSAAGKVHVGHRTYTGDVINPIPPQRAAGFIRQSGLTNGGDWADVDPLTYESVESGFAGVYVIGDAQGSNQPKSAHMANSQAKTCADAILRAIAGAPTSGDERVRNITTNSACYSPITYDEASWLTATFRYNPAIEAMELSHLGEAEEWSRENYREMFAWASNLFTDSFF